MSAAECGRAPVASALVRVAVDATPLVGPRTGVGRFVEAVLPRLARLEGVEARPYALSRSARAGELPEGAQRVVVPASVAVRSWGRGGPMFALFPAPTRSTARTSSLRPARTRLSPSTTARS